MAITPTRAMITNRPERIIKGFQRTVIGLISFGSGYRTAGIVGNPGDATVQVVLRASDARRLEIQSEQWTSGSCESTGRTLFDVGAAVIGSRGERATPSALITSKRGRIPLPLRHSVRAECQDRISP